MPSELHTRCAVDVEEIVKSSTNTPSSSGLIISANAFGTGNIAFCSRYQFDGPNSFQRRKFGLLQLLQLEWLNNTVTIPTINIQYSGHHVMSSRPGGGQGDPEIPQHTVRCFGKGCMLNIPALQPCINSFHYDAGAKYCRARHSLDSCI